MLENGKPTRRNPAPKAKSVLVTHHRKLIHKPTSFTTSCTPMVSFAFKRFFSKRRRSWTKQTNRSQNNPSLFPRHRSLHKITLRRETKKTIQMPFLRAFLKKTYKIFARPHKNYSLRKQNIQLKQNKQPFRLYRLTRFLRLGGRCLPQHRPIPPKNKSIQHPPVRHQRLLMHTK